MIDEPVPTMPEMVPARRPTMRTNRRPTPFTPKLVPRPEERRLRRVSKDEAEVRASWFETALKRLLTMRGVRLSKRLVVNPYLRQRQKASVSGVKLLKI